MQALQADNERLRARVAELEKQLTQARTHRAGCLCSCPGARDAEDAMADVDPASASGAAAPPSAEAEHVASQSQSQSQNPAIMDILFGDSGSESSKRKRGGAAATPTADTATTASGKSPHHLSPPRTRARQAGGTSPSFGSSLPSASASASATSSSPAASQTEADRMLALLEEDELGGHLTRGARGKQPAKSAGSKRKSGDAKLDAPSTTTGDDASTDMVDADDASTTTRAGRASKFIRVTSPSGGDASRRAASTAVAEDDDAAALEQAIQPSQDAFEAELEKPAASADEAQEHSPEYNYGDGLAHSANSLTDSAKRVAYWSPRVAPLDLPALAKAQHQCNLLKTQGNDAFNEGGTESLRRALSLYTRAIEVVDVAFARSGHPGEGELKAWIELERTELTEGAEAVKEDLQVIRELTAEMHPSASPGSPADAYTAVRVLLRMLASVYANRATCFARSKPPELRKAIGDVNAVLMLQPAWAKGYSLKGSILTQQQCYAEAICLFEQALALPGLSKQDLAKNQERLRTAQQGLEKKRAQEKKGVSAGGDGCTSQSCGSLASSHVGGGAAAAGQSVMAGVTDSSSSRRGRAPTRSHSAAAGSSSSSAALSSRQVGAAAGSAAAPIPLPRASSDFYAQSGSEDSVQMVKEGEPQPLSELAPVHPPSLHTPTGSTPPLGRQQSAEAMQEAIAAAEQKEEAARQQQQAPHTPSRRDKKSVAQVKLELSRSPLPPSGAQLPLTDASNRASPQRSSRLQPPSSPDKRSTRHAAQIHDLTQSPTKAPAPASSQSSARSGGAAPSTPSRAGIIPRERASPSRSPARGRSPTASPARERPPPGSPRSGGSAASSAASSLAEDWFVFPIVSPEALRDLLGDETYAESLAVLDSRKIQVKVEKSTGGAAAAGAADGQGFPKLLGRVQRNSAVGSRRRLAAPSSGSTSYNTSVSFNAEQKCASWSCQCHEERIEHEEERDRVAAAAAADKSGLPGPPSPPAMAQGPAARAKHWTVCKHVGATLLVLQRKQHESEKAKPLDWAPAERARRSMYITPARRKSKVEITKEAAMRCELESMSKSALEALLAKNGQSKSGTKEQLVARIVENATHGNLPRCPRCKGSLFYANGAYHCRGSFDAVNKRAILCDFHADRVDRSVWQQ